MTDAIETVTLRKEYRGAVALEGLNLRVPAGSLFGVVGRNGAGKSTTLNLLLGLIWPSSGLARIEGHDAHRDGRRAREGLAFIGEESPLYPWLTGAELSRYWRRLSTVWNERAFRRCAERFALPLDRRASALSKGMRTQLSLALAAGKDPRIYMLDEPTAGLDPVSRRQMLRFLSNEVRQSGRTVLLSSHVLSELEEVCTHVAMLDRGRLKVSASRDDLRRQWRRYDFVADQDTFDRVVSALQPSHHESRDGVRRVLMAAPGDTPETVLRGAGVRSLEVREMALEEIFFAVIGEEELLPAHIDDKGGRE